MNQNARWNSEIWNVPLFFTVPSVRIVPQILSWPLQYSFQFSLDQLSYIVWGTNGIIKCTINTRECVYLYSYSQWDSFAGNQILPHSPSKNGSAGGFPGFESAVVNDLTFTGDVRLLSSWFLVIVQLDAQIPFNVFIYL